MGIKQAEEIAKLAAIIKGATYSACITAEFLHVNFYPQISKWRPLDDLEGLLSQISNMVSGIPDQVNELAAQNIRLRKERNEFIEQIISLRKELAIYKEREKTMGWNQS
jgi:hypothetical protein